MGVAVLKLSDRVTANFGAFFTALLVLAVAKLIHTGISRNSPRLRIQGEPACYWTAIGYFLGATFGAWTSLSKPGYLYEATGGLGGFGILIGYGIGMLHGWINLWRADRNKTKSGKPSQQDQTVNTTNPYQPPESPPP